jgi:hypothetical protein
MSGDQIHHWSVEVCVNHDRILTIESECLCGKSDLSDVELEAIRFAAEHLLAFAGPRQAIDFIDIASDDSVP